MTIARTTKILLLSLLTTLLLLQSHHSHHRNFHYTDHYQLRSAADHCSGTLYPDLCISTLSTTVPDLHKKSLIEVIRSLLNTTLVPEVRRSASNCSSLLHHRSGYLTPLQHRALDDCLELFASTLDELKAAAKDMATRKVMPIRRHYHDIQTLLSGAMTNQYTCMDGFAVENSTVRNIRNYIQPELLTISHHFSNSLAMLKKTRAASPPSDEDDTDEDTTSYRMRDDGFPTWMMGKDRRLLQAATNKTKVDVVVAKDGTGSFTTIGAAVGAARNKSTTRYVIYIKAGTYFENVEVDKKKTNIMFLGDGIGKTVIKGNRNVVDGFTTFHSATVAVVGAGFIAKGITFENYAGPTKHQAVALRSGSDLSAFYQCSFVGYQDTLYTHSLRQFYRDCDIYGTIDFIFGNAAVVFQNCNLYARKPLYNQKNIYTAQGREDPNQNTGISILNCKVAAASDLAANKSATKTYLGRPWREYSRTVYMLSYIDDVVDPAGWLEWNGTFALKTLYYGEYKNRGPGSNTSARVTWPGYRVINDSAEASGFTVGNLIQGGQWLPSYNIPFFLNLTT